MRALRYTAIGLAALLGLAVIAAIAVSLFVDPNRYKPEIIRAVQERTGRTLAIDGRIGLTFFPRLGVSADKLALSGRGGNGRFASVGEARIAVALLPLLAGRIVVDHVELSELDVDLVRHKDGTTNFDDLMGRDAKPQSSAKGSQGPERAQAFALDIGGIRLRKSNVAWRDEAEDRSLRLAGLDATTGRIADGARGKLDIATRVEGTRPQLGLDAKGSAEYAISLARGAFALEDIDLKVTGDTQHARGIVATVKGDVALDPEGERVEIARLVVAATTGDGLDFRASVPKLRLAPSGASGDAATAELKLARADRTVTAKLALSPLSAKEKRVRFERLAIDADVKQGDAELGIRLASPVSIDFDAKSAEIASLAGDIVASGPQFAQKTVKGAVSGSARLAWGTPSSARADLAARLEDSNLKAKIVVANLDDPAVQFDAVADRLDVDRYLPPQAAAKRTEAQSAAAKGGTAPQQAGAPAAAADTPIDLSGLKRLTANGTVRIGALVLRRIKAQNLNVGLRAAGGRIDIAPLNATLYGGTLSGSASVDANTSQFAIREQLAGVAVGALLRDAAGFDRVEGRGNVSVDLTATGTTIDALKRALNGNARIELHDGAVKGINLGEIAKAAGTLVGSKSSLEGGRRASDQTEFAELTGSFAIRNGVAHNSDLSGESPLLKVSGRGTVDIGAGRIDYLVFATPVGAIPIGGGRQITALQGVSVPVRISGPLDSPAYSVDAAALAVESAKTGVKLTIEKSPGAPGAAQAIQDLLRGLRGKK